MEHISASIVARMIVAGVIKADESAEYTYYVQLLFQRTISYSILFISSLILRVFIPTLIFTISFSLIRTFSGGYHCSKYWTCILLSTVVALSTGFIFPLIKMVYSIYQGGVILSMIIVILIGSINDSNINWNEDEYRKVKNLSRFAVGIEIILLVILIALNISLNIRFYISYGIVVCAISMLLEIRKRGGMAYE